MGNKFDVNKVNFFYSWNFDENSYLLWEWCCKTRMMNVYTFLDLSIELNMYLFHYFVTIFNKLIFIS